MATTSSEAKVRLKLLIDSKAKRVLFAEAGKDFVDFLFNILHLPVGVVVRLLTEQTMVGTLGNLYGSIKNMSETYFLSNQTKDYVLKPKAATQVPLLSIEGGTSSAQRHYSCSDDEDSFHASSICLNFEDFVTDKEATAAAKGSFVKGGTYMVTDDLVVTPGSPISSITMLNKLNIKDVGALEERVVEMGKPEGLKLLKASLQSKTVLTSVFLENTTVEYSPPMPRW
ncbi:hypothetical protein Vadar_004690 [Vaccinium darrowii]|uniref:Uncharacterized protein n=1 Tax=Vaccinium darrowii TaxID=229202 RepID=A0ACB7XFE1_9ERIC|nr:hypothetical protein Vadar_004690 [Vaccinium darrowii]